MKTTNQLIGTIGSDPRTGTLPDGRPYIGFRLAVNHSYFNSETGTYEEGETSWYDVAAYGSMAQSAACSLRKGDPVLVVGRLRVRDWENGERSGTSVELVADALGHNLRFGTGSFRRHTARRREQHAGEGEPSGGDPGGPWGLDPVDATARGSDSEQPAGGGSTDPTPVAAGAVGDGGDPPF